jgi:hypothetical protein
MKGAVSSDVLAMIAPHEGIRLRPIHRAWFRVMASGVLVLRMCMNRVQCIIVDNIKTQQWVMRMAQWRRVPIIMAQEHHRDLSYSLNNQTYSQHELLRVLPCVH